MNPSRRSSGILYVGLALLVALQACGPQAAAQPTSPPNQPPGTQSADALATAVAQALAETQAAAPPTTVSAGAAWFSDDFSLPELEKSWSWIREDSAAWSLSEQAGWLRLLTSQKDLLGAGGEAPLLIHAAPEGDFEIRTRMDFSPAQDFLFAGVLVYADDDHFVALGRGYCGVAPICVGDGVYIDNDETFMAGESGAIAVGSLPSGAIWLRLVREGATYTGFWSRDGEAWSKVGTTTSSLIPASVGIMATTGESGAPTAPAFFDLFQVLAISPVDVSAGKVCDESMASLEFVSNGYLASGWFLVTLAKPEGFEAQEYTLLVNGQASACSILSGNTGRIYCTSPYIPPTGLIPIQLLSADSSCAFETPLDAMSVIPKPQPTSSGPYY